MSLEVTKELVEKVDAEALKAYAEECCGFLIGPTVDDFEKQGRKIKVDEIRALPNGWEKGERARRYEIDSKFFARVETELNGTGRGIVGFYHSHPDHPARPSQFDLDRAWPCYSYWIVSVRKGKIDSSRSWMRSEDGKEFVEEPLEISGG